jgi:2-haloalkanoic acid dehalogenase type II
MVIKYIFFDLGDTLIDMSTSNEALCFGLKSVLPNGLITDEMALKWKKESCKVFERYCKKGEFYTIKKLQTISLKNVLLKYDVDLPEQKLIDIVNKFWRYFIKNCKLYDDVLPTLSQLTQEGYELGLITDGDEENVTRTLKQHNLDSMFRTKVISSAIRRYKPDQLLFQRALELAKCLPQEAIYVSNSAVDIYGAKKIGLTTVLISRNKIQNIASEIEPDFSIENINLLPTIINKNLR